MYIYIIQNKYVLHIYMLPSLGLAPNMCISYRYVCVYLYVHTVK